MRSRPGLNVPALDFGVRVASPSSIFTPALRPWTVMACFACSFARKRNHPTASSTDVLARLRPPSNWYNDNIKLNVCQFGAMGCGSRQALAGEARFLARRWMRDKRLATGDWRLAI